MVDHLRVKYTFKKRNVFYFSKRVPKDIRSHYTRDRIIICLKTKSDASASRACKSLIQKLEDYWLSIRLTQFNIPAQHLIKTDKSFTSNAPLLIASDALIKLTIGFVNLDAKTIAIAVDKNNNKVTTII